MLVRVEPAEAQDALQGVDVGGEIEGVGDDLRPAAFRPIESADQGVDVDRGRARHDDLVGGGADERRAAGPEALGQVEPGRIGLEPAPDGQAFPGADGRRQRALRVA